MPGLNDDGESGSDRRPSAVRSRRWRPPCWWSCPAWWYLMRPRFRWSRVSSVFASPDMLHGERRRSSTFSGSVTGVGDRVRCTSRSRKRTSVLSAASILIPGEHGDGGLVLIVDGTARCSPSWWRPPCWWWCQKCPAWWCLVDPRFRWSAGCRRCSRHRTWPPPGSTLSSSTFSSGCHQC